MTCHKERFPGLHNQWHASAQAQHGMTCYDCHAAAPGEADAYQHEGAIIATLVTPRDCGNCHEKEAQEVGLLQRKAPFGNENEWEHWALWHQEGRRARHGASMVGPDYTWWHGIYEVAHNFYLKLLPAAREIGNPEVNALIDAYPHQLGHPARGKGCFRCHSENIVDKAGRPMEAECTLCHSIIANDSPDPLRFQMAVQETGDPDARMHRYLKEEFLSTLR